ncbi:hypothetical protein WPS_14680 [Vulcanimicrobium alpinum]|uniref:YbaK/aminoacyl-tRNA synthetase-associated domain-containing protein n=1 Tax=Vulcanimicrobium alpinum TaxID=3016050 RepID=A0AAN2CA18_UNVUL|nr:YbaK/EbsC family protein [Vulcanimicrobium alpinum]BDE06192.1 hypothetical protein WPS_14680 [Vulcanimicrobium alpinum]
MTLGILTAVPPLERPDLLAPPVAAAFANGVSFAGAGVAEIDPALADTTAFCERYRVGPQESANCVVLAARREGRSWYAACVVFATTRADVNGLAKKALGASKISFAAMDDAVAATAMEYGGITPIGLPAAWPLLVDAAVASTPLVVVGSGVRRSKLIVPGALLAALPNARVLDGLGRM